MPELPEAETIARGLHSVLAGCMLGKVMLSRRDIVHGDPRPLAVVLSGRRVVRVFRRAKRVILELDPPAELIFRLGMTGRLTACPAQQPVEPHTHLRIAVRSTQCELRFRDPRRFGGIWCLAGSRRHIGKRLGDLGPEPLQIKSKEFRRILAFGRQIKALLMDQGAIAGLGNIYCDESLHAAGVHPLRKADTLGEDEADGLLRAIKSTLRRAIRCKGTTLMDYRQADGGEGRFRKHLQVYQRQGKQCGTCGTVIEKIKAAGRSTFLCPFCQPGGKRRNTETSKRLNV